MLALLLQSMYGAVDLMIVGQFAGDAGSVSAVSTGSTMMNLPMMLVFGLTMGSTVLIGRRIGEEDYDGAGEIVGVSIALFALVAVGITALMLALRHPFAKVMQVPPEAYDATIDYVTICACGTIFIVGYNVISGVFRGLGNSTLPLVFVAIACVVNIFGDLLLVAVFHMGAAGRGAGHRGGAGRQRGALAGHHPPHEAAVPVSEALCASGKGQREPDSEARQPHRPSGHADQRLVSGGQRADQQHGRGHVGGLRHRPARDGLHPADSVVLRLVHERLRGPEHGRAQAAPRPRAMLYGMGTALCIGTVMFVLSFFFGDMLSMAFNRDPEIVRASAQYLKGFSFDCLMVSVLFCFIGYFNGCGKTVFVMAQGLVGALLVRMPFAIWMSLRPNPTLFSIGLATPLASLTSIIMCVIYFRGAHARSLQDDASGEIDN